MVPGESFLSGIDSTITFEVFNGFIVCIGRFDIVTEVESEIWLVTERVSIFMTIFPSSKSILIFFRA